MVKKHQADNPLYRALVNQDNVIRIFKLDMIKNKTEFTDIVA